MPAPDNIKAPVEYRTVECRVDTLSMEQNPMGGKLRGYHDPLTGQNYVIYNEIDKSEKTYENFGADVVKLIKESEGYYEQNFLKEGSEQRLILIHETKHEDDRKKGAFSVEKAVSPRQAGINLIDMEIGAYLAELTAFRTDYINSGGKVEASKFKPLVYGNNYAFYAKAVDRGEINPLSKNPKDFDNEMVFIANNLPLEFMKSRKNYVESVEEWTSEYISDMSEKLKKEGGGNLAQHLRPNQKNFEETQNVCWTVGRINFREKMTVDFDKVLNGEIDKNFPNLDSNIQKEIKEYQGYVNGEWEWETQKETNKEPKRLSPVQKVEILDMRKPIYLRPIPEQEQDKSKNVARKISELSRGAPSTQTSSERIEEMRKRSNLFSNTPWAPENQQGKDNSFIEMMKKRKGIFKD